MKRLAPPDRMIFGSVLLLMVISVIFVASASLSLAEVRYGDPFRIIRHWLFYLPLGLALMMSISRIDILWLKAITIPLLCITLLVMVMVLIPGMGKEINGAQRWFSVFGLTLQPVELLKPVVVLYLAYYMATFPDRLPHFSSGLAPMLVVLATVMTLLLLQPDFGSAVLLATVCLAMWFVGGVPIRHLAGLLLTFVPLGVVALIAEPYRVKRLFSFLDPWADPFGSGYQLVQSVIAFGAGGLYGTGIGQGVQKLFYLPEVFTDFIAAVLAEELGLAGTLLLITIFAVLLGRALWLSMHLDDMFPRLLTLGCTLLLGISFIINLGATMGILPTKGMPMPFVSYGGSALLGNCVLVGMILAIQRHHPQNMRTGNES
ncbi:MAG: putative lipid II flippase FtsW [Mariprofundaceae bacterium]|nr:putative lipid II flippase FtsW [Mariprofundaceae bacterium]